ncbi:class I SAM-dependent methyltransferase [Amycolatopsis sp. NPDC051372]|uniref:class I SAM-dependent DNA methyltransferase n=1 Tax=unclassified Amycolatopsis TaxID=2618356 RepID=UPI00343E7B9F
MIGEVNTGDDPADGWFPESVAAGYDGPGGANLPELVTPVVDVLGDLADGPVLEFAVGTGRIAVPLTARGVPVSGIELSRAMAARLGSKPGGAAVEVTIGDMTTTRVAGRFSMVYLVYNTISNVTTQDGQVDVFRNAAAHLRPGGLFLVEVGLPDLRRLPPGQGIVPFAVARDRRRRRLDRARTPGKGSTGRQRVAARPSLRCTCPMLGIARRRCETRQACCADGLERCSSGTAGAGATRRFDASQ